MHLRSSHPKFPELSGFQEDVYNWSLQNFGDQDYIHPLLGITEEVGELNHAVLKSRQNIRGDYQTHLLEAQDAIGDIMIYMADFCSRFGIDFEECVRVAWGVVRKRNWAKNPNTGEE